jgi:putative NIF3 family GTP cyclohydrolase 1 type 2
VTAVVEAEATETTDTATETKVPGTRGRKPESRDWTEVKQDHIDFANYINEHTNLDITPNQVKASFLLRAEWSNTPERAEAREALKNANAEEKAERARKAEERKAEAAKYANETPEEKEARKERTKTEKAAERAQKRADELIAKAKELREQAGLDTELPDSEQDEPEAISFENDPEAVVEVEEVQPEVEVEEAGDAESMFSDAEKPVRRSRKR